MGLPLGIQVDDEREANHMKTLNTLLDELDNDGNGLIDFGAFHVTVS